MRSRKILKVLKVGGAVGAVAAFYMFGPVDQVGSALGLMPVTSLTQDELRRIETSVAWEVELADGVRPLDVQCTLKSQPSEYSCGVQDGKTSLYSPLFAVVEDGAVVDVFKPTGGKIKSMTPEQARAERAKARAAAEGAAAAAGKGK